MAEEAKKGVKEVKAFARGVHISPRKARLVAHTLKNMNVEEALTRLDFLTKKAALPIKKLMNSAIANAQHNFQIESDRLFIKRLTVDGARMFFRYAPRAQGRAFPVRKRTSHINLTLGVSEKPFAVSKKFKPAAKPAVEEKVRKEVPPVPLPAKGETKQAKTGFWQRFRKKKSEDPTQVPPKQDVKGKSYTGFDRRGNM